MKKHFVVTTVIIDILILILFILGTGIFTYFRATSEMKASYQSIKNQAEFSFPSQYSLSTMSDRDLIMNSYRMTWGELRYPFEETGYYGFVKLADGTVIDTSSDYCVVEILGDSIDDSTDYVNENVDQITNGHEAYLRVFALNEDVSFDSDRIFDMTFTGECDDTFIHSGTMTYLGNTYELKDIGFNSSERIPVSTLFENCNGSKAVIVNLAGNEYEEKLNSEAKDTCESIYNEIEQNYHVVNQDDLVKEDILTSYYMVLEGTPSGAVTGLIYVFHPLETVLRSNVVLYIVLFVILLLVEAIVIYTMRKSYKSRLEQEMRSRRLRRGIAHELKTPLAIAKLYMENQEYIDETERPDYSRKVNRELEDMTGLIDALLEMDKIDSGKDMLKTEEFDINAMIKSVYAHVKPLADERGLEVMLPDDKEYLVKADIKFMRIAVGNYLTNMVKYADKEAKVSINTHGNTVRVVFENDSKNDKKSGIDKLNSNGMGVEINENIMRLHNFKHGSGMYYNKTRFWFEAEKV